MSISEATTADGEPSLFSFDSQNYQCDVKHLELFKILTVYVASRK